MNRHYGMDWLRIGAFALLIFYHVGMVFVPWPFQVKTAQPLSSAALPMLAASAWRLTLLFLVSGYASRALLAKSASPRGFLANRSRRLLVPLAFGIAFVVPPQSWVELVTQHGYTNGFIAFFAHDYFRFGKLDGIILPTWNHLWFVVYLWLYTLALVGLATSGIRVQSAFDRAFAGRRALWLPLAYLLLFQVIFFHRTVEKHDVVSDAVAHLAYFPAFLFGFGLRGSLAVLANFARHWRLAAVLGLASYAEVAWTEWTWPGDIPAPHAWGMAFRVAREVQTWASIAALIGIAERFWNHDHRWRRTLTEAVFPFYLIHQTIIVVAEYWIAPLRLGAAGEFVILVAATVAGCWVFYLVGKRIGWLRPLIGLRSGPARARETVGGTTMEPDDPRRGRAL